MPAHLRPIFQYRCERFGCDRRATQELFNGANALVATYCNEHAGPELRNYQKRHEA